MMHLSRRQFVAGSIAGAYTLGRGLPLLADPSANSFPGMITRMTEPENLEFPFSSLTENITPNEHFFVRSHFAVPKVDIKGWKLIVEGAVKQKLGLTLADLRAMPTRNLAVTLECAGNGRVSLTPAVPGLQWGQGAVGNAEWSGVPLAAVLEKAGLKDSAVEVILEGTDHGQINTDPKSPGPIAFARSLPIEKARSESVILAWKMNGSDLPNSHGYPLRAIVGGWYGMASVKWLSRIIVSDKPFDGWWQTIDYAYWKREETLPTLTPVTGMQPKAEIARPASHEVVPVNKSTRVFGAAWAGEAAVSKVEISVDGGQSWEPAKLLAKPAALTWVFWEHSWTPGKRGRYKLMVKATDTEGCTQPTQRDPDRRTYMINHLTPVEVVVN